MIWLYFSSLVVLLVRFLLLLQKIIGSCFPWNWLYLIMVKASMIDGIILWSFYKYILVIRCYFEKPLVSIIRTFTSDQLIWHRDYWKYLTRAYGPKRSFLSRDKQIMNTIRFAFFSLIESRLQRVESKNYQNTLVKSRPFW